MPHSKSNEEVDAIIEAYHGLTGTEKAEAMARLARAEAAIKEDAYKYSSREEIVSLVLRMRDFEKAD